MLEQKYINGQTAVKIARSIESAVAAGKIEAGEQLPTVRELAKRLGVSGATVSAAYRILQERGVALAEGRRGTRLRSVSPAALPRRTVLPDGRVEIESGAIAGGSQVLKLGGSPPWR